MSLHERLTRCKSDLYRIEAILSRQTNDDLLPSDVRNQFSNLSAVCREIDGWLGIIETRRIARQFLTDLPDSVDTNENARIWNITAQFQHLRLFGTQAYLTTNWSLADQITGFAGKILCTPDRSANRAKPCQLTSDFLNNKGTSAMLKDSIRCGFGWPIAISYALRNHFIHDGGIYSGGDFFAEPTSPRGFAISNDGWERIERKAREHGASSENHRASCNWPTSPKNDLRFVLDTCEHEMDEALGIIIRSACTAFISHVGYLHGEL